MYPSYDVPSVEDVSEWTISKADFTTVLPQVESIQTKGFLKQIIIIQEFALRYFKDLSEDINLVANRIKNVSGHVQKFMAESPAKIKSIKDSNSSVFFKPPEQDVYRDDIDSSDTAPGVRHTNIKELIKNPPEDVSLEGWANYPGVKDIKDLKIKLTNPNYYRNQLFEELQNQIPPDDSITATKSDAQNKAPRTNLTVEQRHAVYHASTNQVFRQ